MMVEIADSLDRMFGDFSMTLGLTLGDVGIGFDSTDIAGEGCLTFSCGAGNGTFRLGNEDLPAFAEDVPRWVLDVPCPACVFIG